MKMEEPNIIQIQELCKEGKVKILLKVTKTRHLLIQQGEQLVNEL